MKRKSMKSLSILLVLAVFFCRNEACAAENDAVPTGKDEIVSVVLPVIEERDPFSFFIDPLHIFYNTFGNSGGDIMVEEDTYLLFYNRDESEYTLSSRSDSLEIINKSTVPVEVTITARIEEVDGISVMQEAVFEDRSSCDLYLALVDNEGNEQPLSEDGEVSVTVNLDRAPLDAYAYVFNEDTEEYEYVCQAGDVAFDTCSFGLTGACNEKGDWTGISGTPHVTISWNVEPVIPDSPDTAAGDEEPVAGNEESAAGDEKPVDEDREPVEGDQDPVEGDKDPAGNEETDTGNQVSEGDGSDEGKTTEESGPDSGSSGAAEEEGAGSESPTDESSAAEDKKDESGALEEDKEQESDKPNGPAEDSSAAKEEESGSESSAGESSAAEDKKNESGALEEEKEQETNKPDEPVEDPDVSAATMDKNT